MCGISCIVLLPDPATGQDASHSEEDHGERTEETDSAKHRLHDEMQKSLEIIKHRGPDASGVWISEDERIGRVNMDRTFPLDQAEHD